MGRLYSAVPPPIPLNQYSPCSPSIPPMVYTSTVHPLPMKSQVEYANALPIGCGPCRDSPMIGHWRPSTIGLPPRRL
ncbi:hypothetical protein L208DRAFT_1392849 [Tricholoma matsutake]|nr:hypothetical protein L208DRAFT_1392849 [Tricholoma matsutake 945]